ASSRSSADSVNPFREVPVMDWPSNSLRLSFPVRTLEQSPQALQTAEQPQVHGRLFQPQYGHDLANRQLFNIPQSHQFPVGLGEVVQRRLQTGAPFRIENCRTWVSARHADSAHQLGDRIVGQEWIAARLPVHRSFAGVDMRLMESNKPLPRNL